MRLYLPSMQPRSCLSCPLAEGPAPHSIFITAIDTQPLAADPALIIARAAEAFACGIDVLGRLTQGKVYLCQAPGAALPVPQRATLAQFSGVHPAGNVGTHIHFLDPVHAHKTVWSIGYQDVIAIGHLFTRGRLDVSRVVSLAGPGVLSPRLLQTRLGANVHDLTQGELCRDQELRLISGSVFSGRTACDALGFLGRYHNQISVLAEGRERPFLHYMVAGRERFSVKNIYLSKLLGHKLFDFTTTTNGSDRAMVPIGQYEQVMPLDILPTQLLRALIVGDLDMAEKLGALELDEEDLALCTFVCAGKYEYGPILRANLTAIEKEG